MTARLRAVALRVPAGRHSGDDPENSNDPGIPVNPRLARVRSGP